MRIGVVGCGAVGSYYGAQFARAGHDVHFLLRSDYDAVRRAGLLIRSPDGDFRVEPACAKKPDEIGACDLVLIALKTTANDQFATLIPPLVDARTAVLTLQNGLGNEDRLADLFGGEKILGGLCFVCLNRRRAGEILHLAHGQVTVGEYRRPPLPRTRALISAFRHARVACELAEDLERARWEKLVWNVPFNGLGVAGVAGYEALVNESPQPVQRLGRCLPADQLLDGDRWERLLRELMHEIITAAQGLGLPVATSLAETMIAKTRIMGAYQASTLLDFERGQPIELESMFLEPLRRARRAGIPTPRLARLCDVLSQLDQGLAA